MKKCDKDTEGYRIVSELSHHYDDDDDDFKLTQGQAKFIVVLMSLLLIGVVVFVIIDRSKQYNQLLEEEARLEAQLEEEEARHEELMAKADELCQTRVQRYTEDGIVQLDAMLYDYKFEPTENGWVCNGDRLAFDFSDESRLVMRYQKSDSEEIYIHKNTNKSSTDDYQCKIGAQIVIFSQSDMRALGRVLIGGTEDFYLE